MEINDKKELTEEERENAYVLWFNQLRRADVALVGGKSSLGELTSGTDVPVPYGFATTARGYRHFMEVNGLNEKVNALLATLKGRTRKTQKNCTGSAARSERSCARHQCRKT